MDIFRKNSDEVLSVEENLELRKRFEVDAEAIYKRHFEQDIDRIALLRKKYTKSVIGKMKVIDAIRLLGECIDPSDTELFCTSQLMHTLQVAESISKAKMGEMFIVVALVHDLGKILLLTDEDPANVVCPNEIVGTYQSGVGLENVITHWNHDEYIYQKLKPFLDDDSLWLLRYHSFRFDVGAHVLNSRDWERKSKLLEPFRFYDLKTKSPYNLPKTKLSDYTYLLDKYFPRSIQF